ncbi:hypothetical protein ACFWY6_29370 [Streptomyces sp. NPDC059037]|uniref:hypothetical protein n=1 Tax=Streptomyces sp. NPDC059037 TaxID=3346710 RepID=UPI0036A19116
MFSRQKIAAVSGLLGSLAVIYVGAEQAYAHERPRDCKTNVAKGETICIRKSETIHTDKHGRYVIRQTQECETVSQPPYPLPNDSALSKGSKHVGPVLECSNKTHLPKGFKRPHFTF